MNIFQVLSQHRPKEILKNQNENKDLKDFIIDESVDEESSEEKEKLNTNKKKINRKLIHSRIKNSNDCKSSSDSSNKSDSDDFDEQYERDLQLFYIRTTNSLNKNKLIFLKFIYLFFIFNN